MSPTQSNSEQQPRQVASTHVYGFYGPITTEMMEAEGQFQEIPDLDLPSPVVPLGDHSVDAEWTSLLTQHRVFVEKRKYGAIRWTDMRTDKTAQASNVTGAPFVLSKPKIRKRSPGGIKWFDMRGGKKAEGWPLKSNATKTEMSESPVARRGRSAGNPFSWFDQANANGLPAQPDFLDLGMFTPSTAASTEPFPDFVDLTETDMDNYEQIHESDDEQESPVCSVYSPSSYTDLDYLLPKSDLIGLNPLEQVADLSSQDSTSTLPATDSDYDSFESFMNYINEQQNEDDHDDDDFYDGEEAIIEEAQIAIQHRAPSHNDIYNGEDAIIEEAQVAMPFSIPQRHTSLGHLSMLNAGLVSQARRSFIPSPSFPNYAEEARVENARTVRFYRPSEPVRSIIIRGRMVFVDRTANQRLERPWESDIDEEERPKSRRQKLWEKVKGKVGKWGCE